MHLWLLGTCRHSASIDRMPAEMHKGHDLGMKAITSHTPHPQSNSAGIVVAENSDGGTGNHSQCSG
jgi:hypothetical protein